MTENTTNEPQPAVTMSPDELAIALFTTGQQMTGGRSEAERLLKQIKDRAAASAVRVPATDRTACRTTQHCAYHGWCHRCDPAFADAMSAVNVAIQRTDADESHWGPLYEAVGKALRDALLPEPADRAAVLREAANIAEGLRQFQPAYGARWSAQVSENVGILRVVDHLRQLAVDADGNRLAAGPAAAGPDQTDATRPRRGDAVEAWLKRQRDRYDRTDQHEESSEFWHEFDTALDLYRLHADTGTPLGEHVCEARVVGDCECLEAAPAVGGAQQADRIVAYRSPGGHYLYCPLHADRASWTPVTAEDLRDGGICTVCYVDVLIEQQPTEA